MPNEVILETWSLFINQVDKKFLMGESGDSYQVFLEKEFKSLMNIINVYIPQSKQMVPTDFEMVPTFMHIFDLVLNLYENKIMNYFPSKLERCFPASGTEQFCSYSIGFKIIHYSMTMELELTLLITPIKS